MKEATERLDYRYEDGEDPTAVFIHGWLGSKDFWEHVTPEMSLDNAELFYDQRCHGGSDCSSFSIESLAEDLRSLLEELGIEEPILIGHSMGGMVALKYSTMHDASGLCLLGTSASTPEPERRSVEFFHEKFEELSRGEWADMIADNYVRDEDEAMRQMTKLELEKADEKPIKDGLEAMQKYDVTGELDPETEALVVAGEHDGAIKMEKSREVADLLDAELAEVPTGHQMLPEAPEQVGRLIQRFVEECST